MSKKSQLTTLINLNHPEKLSESQIISELTDAVSTVSPEKKSESILELFLLTTKRKSSKINKFHKILRDEILKNYSSELVQAMQNQPKDILIKIYDDIITKVANNNLPIKLLQTLDMQAQILQALEDNYKENNQPKKTLVILHYQEKYSSGPVRITPKEANKLRKASNVKKINESLKVDKDTQQFLKVFSRRKKSDKPFENTKKTLLDKFYNEPSYRNKILTSSNHLYFVTKMLNSSLPEKEKARILSYFNEPEIFKKIMHHTRLDIPYVNSDGWQIKKQYRTQAMRLCHEKLLSNNQRHSNERSQKFIKEYSSEEINLISQNIPSQFSPKIVAKVIIAESPINPLSYLAVPIKYYQLNDTLNFEKNSSVKLANHHVQFWQNSAKEVEKIVKDDQLGPMWRR